MQTHIKSESGFSLIETMISLAVLTIGTLGIVGIFVQGMRSASSSPGDLTSTQKAAEAIESVFSARDSHTIAWDDLRNGAHGGIFLDGPQSMAVAGADGIVNTSDDGDVEEIVLPGPDQLLGTGDDVTHSLADYTREIRIEDVTDDLRSVTVIISQHIGAATRDYTLTAYISRFA